MKIAVIADTRLPRGRRRLPLACIEAIGRADLTLHAGDLVSAEVLDSLREIGPPVHAVHGNVDSPELRRRLPERLELELEGARIAIVHDAGPARGRAQRLRRMLPGADAVVFGHTHLPQHEQLGGFQIFNPASPTERRRAPHRSMGVAEVVGGRIAFRHVELS